MDLGQGYSDFLPPEHIISALDQVVKDKNVSLHQYTRGCVSCILFRKYDSRYIPDGISWVRMIKSKKLVAKDAYKGLAKKACWYLYLYATEKNKLGEIHLTKLEV